MLNSESWRRASVIGIFLLSMTALAACEEEPGVGDTGETTTEEPATAEEPAAVPEEPATTTEPPATTQ